MLSQVNEGATPLIAKTHFMSMFLRAWFVVSAIRISAFTILLILDVTQNMSASAVLLTLPLYPEALAARGESRSLPVVQGGESDQLTAAEA